ncbi:winged helix-turn-helix transcriptional regulator [Aurantibacter sp.]|uniref:winged helix-turn-helix transcriptional regulator n=1 Tax=Aurantibacter sp. TaxID=2807103 RepID=UPI0035C7B5DC
MNEDLLLTKSNYIQQFYQESKILKNEKKIFNVSINKASSLNTFDNHKVKDSTYIENLILDYKFFYKTNEFEKAEGLLCELLQIAQMENQTELQEFAYSRLSRLSLKQFDYLSAKHYCFLALEINTKYEYLHSLSVSYLRLGQYEKAAQFAHKGLIYAKKDKEDKNLNNKVSILLGAIYYDVAVVYNNDKELLGIAKHYFEQVIINDGHFVNFELAQMNIAGIEEKLHQYKNARNILLKILDNLVNQENRKYIYYRIAKIYYAENNLELAKIYCEKAILKLNPAVNDYFAMDFHLLLAQINKQLGLNTIAKRDAYKVYRLANISTGYTNQIAQSSKLLAKLYKLEENQDSAYFFIQKYSKFRDEVSKRQDDNKLLTLHLVQIHKQNIIDEKQKIFEMNFTIYSLVSIILISVFIILYLRKKKHNTLNQELSLELKSLKEIVNMSLIKSSIPPNKAIINKKEIETQMECKLNDTDWSILNTLIDNPIISNKVLSQKVHLSIAGVRSSLKKMYSIFGIDNSYRDKRILLVMKVADLFNKSKD